MESLSLEANKRTTLGKKTRFLRRQGITPANLFGHGLESISLEIETAMLQKVLARAGRTRLIALGIKGDKEARSVFVKDIQKNVLSGEVLHVDLYQVKKDEKVRVEVPLVLVGDSPAMKGKGGTLTNPLNQLSIECLPDQLPPQINVDLGLIQAIGQAIYVKDLTIGPGIIVHSDPDQLVARVAEIYVEKSETAEARTGAEAEAAAPAESAEKKPEEQA
jgi:large subunit ribosomal protein L25